MGLPFFNRDSVRQRLDNTICLWEGKPIYVTTRRLRNPGEFDPLNRRGLRRNLDQLQEEALNDNIVVAYEIPVDFNKPLMLDYTNDRFNYKAFPLGYMNIAGNAYYLTRNAYRQFAQGLSMDCITAHPGFRGYYQWFPSLELKRCILGQYPSLEAAKEEIRSYRSTAVAFGRETAICRFNGGAIQLLYRGKAVGFSSLDGDKFTLYSDRSKKALEIALEHKVNLA